jgi:hypothetical protein
MSALLLYTSESRPVAPGRIQASKSRAGAIVSDKLQHGKRQGELIESEVARRKRIKTRNLKAHVAPKAHPNGTGLDEIELDAGRQMFEHAVSTRKEPSVCCA